MAVNKSKNHLIIIPEDAPYKDMADAFLRHFAVADKYAQVMKPARGWLKVKDTFLNEFEPRMQNNPNCHILLLLDLDKYETRYKEIISQFASNVRDRVFILSSLKDAEKLRKDLNCSKPKYVGEKLVQSCYDSNYGVAGNPWLCAQLQHNKSELTRLAETVRPFIFS